MKSQPITLGGLKQVQEELDFLIKTEREQLKIAISEARELGDLKENAEYHAAKEKQSLIEGRIGQLQGIVASAEIIDPKVIKSKTIVFGATVSILNLDLDESLTYQIVGASESNMRSGKISYLSPIGKALIGKEEGDIILVKAPRGDIEYEIEKIKYL